MSLTITLAGPYPPDVPGLLRRHLPAEFELREIHDQASLDASRDLQFVILRTLTVNAALIGANPGLTFIQRWGAGYDSVDIEAAGARGIPVAVAAGVNSNAVAEHALLLMLASLRHLTVLDASTKGGQWDRTSFAQNSYTIADKTLGLVGCGAIGRLVAAKARALGAAVIYHDAFRLSAQEEQTLGLGYAPLDRLLAESDIVSLHLPLTDSTKNIIDRRALQFMKRSAILINTSRGGLVDEEALAAALREGPLMAAAMDSFATEPYPADGPLLGLENLIMTPHIGGSVADLTLPMVRKVAENTILVARGLPLSRRDLVNQKLCGYPAA